MRNLIVRILNKFRRGFCCQCGKITSNVQMFADDVDEEGQPTGYKDYCCESCFEGLLERL